MKIAYFDCSSGISGDMVLGAFIDLGLSVKKLKQELLKLKAGSFDLKVSKVKRGHIKVTKVDVVSGSKKRFNDLNSMNALLDKSMLDPDIVDKVKYILVSLAKAEAKVHKQSLTKVHFHQLGQLDTIIDITGCVIALKMLKIDKIYSSPVVSGCGTIRFGKNTFPLPAPAVTELLKKRNIKMDPNIGHETVTPTGAVILACLTDPIESIPVIQIEKTGYGAGSYIDEYLPNSFRIVLGSAKEGETEDYIYVIETNIDDTLGLNFDVLFERLFEAGALDVYTCSVMMKKQRPGILLAVQSEERSVENIINTVFKETSTIGLRLNKVGRRKLNRKILKLKTDYGIIVRVKIAYLGGKVINIAPEYEDCRKIAKQKALPFKTVHECIKAQAVEKFKDNGF